MTRAAPRIDSRLLAALGRLDRAGRPIAETNRRVGILADRLGLPRPSYQQVRVLVHEARARRAVPGAGEVLLDIALQKRPPEAVLDVLEGKPSPRLRK